MPDDPRTRSSDAAPSTPPAPVDGSGPLGERRLADDLWVDSETAQDRVRVRVSGQIDLDVAGPLDEALEQALHASSTGLDVDLSAVTFCNSTGLNTLLRLRLTALRTGRDVVITEVSAQVGRLLAITDTRGLFAPGPDGRPGRPGADDTAP
ncbi:STAS domain-containing protein [Kitasatospora sp. NPDC058218]|uniref:STAS domain-containing protein n=1 Tax=Kitasatospora sp. NPDC058218 TaxID=3346385 RepID=UPI0036DF4B58